MTSAADLTVLAGRVEALIARYRPPVIEAMRAALNRPDAQHLRYARYHLGWEDADGRPIDAPAGKMLRPALCLLCCEAVGGEVDDAIAAAAAIELLHNFTLIHDDIEDRSESRHGRPTLWRVVGIEQAINAGDGLFALAQRTMLDARARHDDSRVLQAVTLLDDACIALCEGQYMDIGFEARASVTPAEYEAMVAGKTAALLGASAAIGAIFGGAEDGAVTAFARMGMLLGLAFQVQDDVLGVWGDPALTGKSAADDVRARKKSFPVAHAFGALDDAARDELAALYGGDDDTEATTARIVELLDASGARDAATHSATEHLQSALSVISALELQPDRRADIESIATFFVHRDR
jgi:geranylgeranyl diphosphate synthase type I